MLDAKYRDLWEHDLPREMLYQLAIYALSRAPGSAGATATSVILYPTLAAGAREARIEIRDLVRGSGRGTVVLRPVDMLKLSQLVALPDSPEAIERRQRLAKKLCFGEAE